MVACPALAEQRDPYEKGDIKHTNIYNWEEEKVEKEIRLAKQRATLARRCVGPRPAVVPPTASRRGAGDPPPPSVPVDGPVGSGGLTRGAPAA